MYLGLGFDFDKALKSVQVEVGMNYDVDKVTKEDVEYLDNLLAGFTDDQPINDAVFDVDNKPESDPGSFNEISCNINQQSSVSDSQSTIRKLLKDDSFKGNFSMKKSTEIISMVSHRIFYDANIYVYFFFS